MDMSTVLVAVLMKTEVPYSPRCSVKISCLFVPYYFIFSKAVNQDKDIHPIL